MRLQIQNRIIVGDALTRLQALPDESVQTCITSPPYFGLRDYGVAGQLGLEDTLPEYIAALTAVFEEVRRVLKKDGTLWLNIGDSYSGFHVSREPGTEKTDRHSLPGWNDGRRNRNYRYGNGRVPGFKRKDLLGVPWRLAFSLQDAGWYLRQDIIWHKPNPMPESVKDRCTKAHEYIFLFSKSEKYLFNHEAIKEDATGRSQEERRNKRSVWTVGSQAFPDAHFAVYPPSLIWPCVEAGSNPGDTVLDPFSGAGTTGLVAIQLQRHYLGIEINPEYAQMGRDRIKQAAPLFNSIEIENDHE